MISIPCGLNILDKEFDIELDIDFDELAEGDELKIKVTREMINKLLDAAKEEAAGA